MRAVMPWLSRSFDASCLFPPDLDRYLRTHLGAEGTARAVIMVLKKGREISRAVVAPVNDDGAFGTGHDTVLAALAQLPVNGDRSSGFRSHRSCDRFNHKPYPPDLLERQTNLSLSAVRPVV